MSAQSWWKGERGEWYVVLQAGLFLLVALGPRSAPGLPAWLPPGSPLGAWAGAALLSVGLALVIAGVVRLGRGLTALPYPKDDGTLIVGGAYAFVRHPMYSGGIFAAVGWALWVHGALTLCYAAALFVFFDVKSRREERWLAEYAGYRGRVRKLIPLVY